MPSISRSRNRSVVALAATGVLVLGLAACSSDEEPAAGSPADETTTSAAAPPSATDPSAGAGDTSSAAASEPAATATITIKDFAYGDPITVAPGTEITVTNLDSAPHDVVPQTGDAWTMKLLEKDQTDTFKAPDTAGSYDFTCSVHPNMAGQLIVS